MSDNIYSAPSAKLVKDEPVDCPAFYIVARRKFWILFVASFGTYALYWHYKHWSNYRAHTKESLWPVARAIFAVFFTHSLFQKIDNKLKETSANHSWSPSTMATLYVVISLADMLSSILTEAGIGIPGSELLFVIFLSVTGWALYSAQKAANVAGSDTAGDSNSRMTRTNILWLVLLGLVWILVILGLGTMYMESGA